MDYGHGGVCKSLKHFNLLPQNVLRKINNDCIFQKFRLWIFLAILMMLTW